MTTRLNVIDSSDGPTRHSSQAAGKPPPMHPLPHRRSRNPDPSTLTRLGVGPCAACQRKTHKYGHSGIPLCPSAWAAGHDKIAEAALMALKYHGSVAQLLHAHGFGSHLLRPPRRRHRSELLVGEVRRLELQRRPCQHRQPPQGSSRPACPRPGDSRPRRHLGSTACHQGSRRPRSHVGRPTGSGETGPADPARPVRGRAHRQNRPSRGRLRPRSGVEPGTVQPSGTGVPWW